jgi:peptidoglycan-associated lipoprotein
MTSRTLRTGAAALGVLFGAAACHHAPVVVASQPVASNDDSSRVARERADSIARADAARRDSMALAEARADSIRRAAEALRLANADAQRTLTAPIHFAFEQADLESADQALLDQKAVILAAHRALELRIDGSTDERGSDEFNVALGMRRAAAARRYLVQHGIDSTRLVITSNGEERPVCEGHDESCWSQNRRDEFVITAGDRQLAMHP